MMSEIVKWLNNSGDRIDCRQIACSQIWSDYDGLIVAKMIAIWNSRELVQYAHLMLTVHRLQALKYFIYDRITVRSLIPFILRAIINFIVIMIDAIKRFEDWKGWIFFSF